MRKKRRPICSPSCARKIGYEKKADTEQSIRLFATGERRVYRCKVCQLWYVTSKSLRKN
jgi:hypothetical protein